MMPFQDWAWEIALKLVNDFEREDAHYFGASFKVKAQGSLAWRIACKIQEAYHKGQEVAHGREEPPA